MIGFKVIDTENGEVVEKPTLDYAINDTGHGASDIVSFKLKFDGTLKVDSFYGLEKNRKRFKAVPSITIDGVEYYHGMVVESIYLSGCIGVLKFGEYTEHFDSEQLSHIGWYVYCYDSTQGIYVRTSVMNEKGEVWFECLGNVWQREHNDRLPLMEE